ncbi:xanthine dehydrogenase family protein molybdopterin-binding subunit [Rhodopila sp.]|jgi:carbon-monoxide dehydrogenase large subunit|uniref:xanthine dehydrogenase family protein molybdopterin-binding subunit n=1 Tax=Rhodopila sp. TaxID=2480087 RepID=UPI002BAB7BD0|nr:xanthine dehydrogenase family protein molybdopterin-binding subunit [Rhodopila sp.]HVZ09978.1 xanthine dehydrogenase family protein molybdopterin-binding subunit [Rhodopila sp.]
MTTKFGLAQPVRRVEDPRLLKGSGRYTDDIVLPGMLFGVVLRSPHAAAKITGIDTAAAKAVPGVRGVYTGADLDADKIGPLPCAALVNNRDGSPQAAPPHPVLARDAVRHVGDPVAFVVADTPRQARDAAEAILVDYETLPSATDLATAMDAGVPAVWPEAARNIAFDWEIGDKAATDAAFAKAAHVTRLTIVNNRIVVNSMEARAAIADYDSGTGRWTLYANTQGGWLVKNLIGPVFGTDPEKFRVITPDVGGGFGMKLFLYAEHVLTCYAARKLGRPVKWASDRTEAFLADTQGRDNITTGELAIDADGLFTALRIRNVANMGAYLSTFAPYIPTYAGTGVLSSVYGFKAIYSNVLGVFTNTVPVDAYRGAGRPESNYLVERLVDAAARELKVDRVELRRRNMVPPSAMPHETPVGKNYDSGDFRTVLEAAVEKISYAGFAARKAAAAARGRKLGLGLAYYLEATGGDDSERAEIRFADDGYVDVYVGTQSTGQGHETAYVQLTAAQLGIDGDRIRIRQGDTDTIPVGGGTGGARSLYSEGQAILTTADSVINKGKQAAADELEAAIADIAFADGSFSIVGTDRRIDVLALAASQRKKAAAGQKAVILDAAEVAPIKAHTFPNGCHMAEVEIDPDTGVVTLVRYLVCDDFGKTINPLIVRGQVAGGVAQGYGQAVLEHTVFDPDSGQLLSGTLMDYALPRADQFPDIEVELLEIPCATNPLGVKGAGEAGAVGSPPAVINAIIDALRDDGVTHIDMPATPERVWRALAMAKAA